MLKLMFFAWAYVFDVSQSRSAGREERRHQTDRHLFGICPYTANQNALSRV